ncbi:MAG: tetratricopeptide repeat protein [Armatimonadia bacterium]
MSQPPTDDQHPMAAARLYDLLRSLDGDERLQEALGPAPLNHLTVAMRGNRPVVELAPRSNLSEAARALVTAVIAENLATSGTTPAAPERVSTRLPDLRPHLIAARSHLEEGNPGRAFEIVEEALRRWPDNPELLVYEGLSLTALGKHREALQTYQECLRHDPGNLFAHTAAAQLSVTLGQWESALAYASAALALDPKDASALQALGRADEQLGLLTEALDLYRRAEQLQPDLPGLTEDLTRIARRREEDVEVELLTSPTKEPPAPPETPPGPEEQPSDFAAQDGRWATIPRADEPAGDLIPCPHCETPNPPRVGFCVHCGRRL